MTVKKRLYLLYIHIMSYDTYRGYFKPKFQNPNELILLRYHKLNREKQAKEILPAFIYLFCRLNLDYKLPKKKKKKSLLSF